MWYEKGEKAPERLRVPEVARRTSALMAAIEQATPEAPVSLNMALEGNGTLIELVEQSLARTEDMYDEHEELFAAISTPAVNGDKITTGHDFLKILKLSHKTVMELRHRDILNKYPILAFVTLELASAGAWAAEAPDLLKVSGTSNDFPKQLNDICTELAVRAGESFEEQVVGNINKVPLSREGHLGFLATRHRRFWDMCVQLEQVPESLHSDLQRYYALLPSKIIAYDSHAYAGSPDRAESLKRAHETIDEFRLSVEHGESGVYEEVRGNLRDAYHPVEQTLKAADRAGFSPDEALQLVIQNSAVIGELTKRTNQAVLTLRDNNDEAVHFEGRRLVIDTVPVIYPNLSPEMNDMLQHKEQTAGTCPARRPIRLNRGGQTHKNIETFSKGVKEAIGVEPPLLHEIGGELYLNPAALVVCFTAYGIAVN